MTIGFRVVQRKRAVTADVTAAFLEVPVANVSDCMGRLFGSATRLRPIHDGDARMAGPALTVRSRPGDNLMLHYALDIAQAGDVIVVDAGGAVDNAIMGELMAEMAVKRGIAGIVINGAVRDVTDIRATGLPVYATGITHRGPYKNGPGEINVDIALDGMTVSPGDLILGDGDGVLCVPFDQTGALLAAARQKMTAEKAEMQHIRQGTSDRAWVVEALRAGGCVFE
nr:RraA family protein [uncultured Shinella sp.]